MLGVHPPQGDIHTWKGFFLHIVTITIGLLIAIALEQTVEYVHHANQLQAVRRELAAEIDLNRDRAVKNAAAFAKLEAHNWPTTCCCCVPPRRPMRRPPVDYSWLFVRPQTALGRPPGRAARWS